MSEHLPIASQQGARIVIHDNNAEPFPEAFGYNVLANTISSISVKKVIRLSLPIPETACLDTDNPYKVLPPYEYHGNYTLEGCLRTCWASRIRDDCNCSDPQYPMTADSQHCRYTPETDKCMVAATTTKRTSEESVCGICRPPCKTVEFAATISMSNWEEACDPAVTNCEEREKISSQIVEVFFEQLMILEMVEGLAYEKINLLSEMAGMIGFWAGISMITLLECGYFLCCRMGKILVYDRITSAE